MEEEKNRLWIDENTFLQFYDGYTCIADSVKLWKWDKDKKQYTSHSELFGKISLNGSIKQRIDLFQRELEAYRVLELGEEEL